MKRVLAPVVALLLPVLGAISDAQESLLQAIADLWPSISHQLCQFHALREASRPIYEQDRKLKVEIRKALQECVRKVRKQLQQQRQNATQAEAAQVAVLADYALGIQSAINLEGKQPSTYAGIAVYDALMALQESLEQVEKLEALIEQRPAQLHLVQVTLEELERSNVFLVPLNEHTANLYRKLSVNNCRAAVSLAKSLAKKCLFGQVFPHLSEKGKTWPKGEGVTLLSANILRHSACKVACSRDVYLHFVLYS